MDDTAPEVEGRSRGWKQDPAAVRADILAAARAAFAARGLAGTRVQDIADRTQTSKRMIFYYFGDKEGLYRAVLEEAYRGVRAREAALNLGDLPPLEALRRLVEFTFDHHRDHPDFIRLVMIENIHRGRHLRDIEALGSTATEAIGQLTRICDAGRAAGVIRADVCPLALHWQISALCFFNVSNRATFSIVFGDGLFTDAHQADLRERVVGTIIASVAA